jgi:TonB-linked SusC/RagA family outer membrane protein
MPKPKSHFMLNQYMRKSILAFCLPCMLLCFTTGSVRAQQQTLRTGIVVDAHGNPVEGVQVSVAGQDSIKVTDRDGYFTLEAADLSTLIFNHPEFYYLESRVGESNFVLGKAINPDKERGMPDMMIKLTGRYLKDPGTIDVLYGTAEKNNHTGAVSTIYTSQLTSTPGTALTYALPGRLPGLYTEQYRGIRSPQTTINYDVDIFVGNIPRKGLGAVSDNTEFQLNLRGQSPVTVVDGVQRDIFSIDPENIESVSVQKDALSSILLGMRSSRGVLLITTRKPAGEGFKLSFTGQVGVQRPLNMPEPLSASKYAYLLNEALLNSGRSAIYSTADLEAFRNGSDPYGHPNVNWYNTVLKSTAPWSSYNLNASGGGSVARYSISAGYMNQKGLFESSPGNQYETNLELNRYVINSRIDINVTDDFEVGVSLFGRVQEGIQPGGVNGMASILRGLQNTPNNAYPIYNPNGSFGGNVTFTNNLFSQTINSGYTQDNGRDAMANVDMKYDLHQFVKGLSVKAITNMSTQNITAVSRSKTNPVYQYDPEGNEGGGSYTQYGSPVPQSNEFFTVTGSRFWYGQLSLQYENTFDRHTIGGMLFADKRVVSVNFDLPQRPANLAARVNYSFDDRYFAEGAVNHAKYNGYAPGNQWGTFYAFGAGWKISSEKFLKDVSWLDQLKVRGVFGKTGSGIDNTGYYIWRQTYGQTFQDGTYPQGFGRGTGNGMTENVPLANPNITWEKAHKVDLGVDVSLFDNTLQFVGDFYYDKYYDLLQPRGKSVALIGFAYPAENIGRRLNSGIELSVTYQNRIGEFNYYITGNWSRMRTEVLFQDEQFREHEYNRRTGKSANAIYGLVADKFFDSVEEIQHSATIQGVPVQPGDIKYKDLNGDNVIDQFDHTAIGNTKPLSFYGVTFGFNYKGFDVSVLLQGVYNRDIDIANGDMHAGFQVVGQSYGQAYEHMTGRWTPETAATATYPRLTAGSNANNMPPFWSTSFWVRSGDYFRVKNVSLGYTLPVKFTGRFNVSEVKLFVNAQNLFTEASYDLADPEVTNFTNYPMQGVMSAGVNVKL